jgi:hypothetical protein
MKQRNLALLVSGVVAALVMLAGGATRAQAQAASPGPAKVVKLRVDKVALYDEPNGKKVLDYPRGEFTQPWPVIGRSDKGFLQVEVKGSKYWVRGYAVETDTPFRIGADCDAVVASRQPKAGVTRGIGEECKK